MDDFGRFINDVVRRDRQERRYLLLYLKGLPEPINLAIDQAEVRPFRQRLLRPNGQMAHPSPFYWLSTFDGKEALISLPDVEYVNFLFQLEQPLTALLADSTRELQFRTKEDQFDRTVDLYFRDRPAPIPLRVSHSVKLKHIFEQLTREENPDDSPFISFTDDQDQTIVVRPEQLTLLVAHRGSIQMTSEADYEALFHSE